MWAFPPKGPCDVPNPVRCELPEGTTLQLQDGDDPHLTLEVGDTTMTLQVVCTQRGGLFRLDAVIPPCMKVLGLPAAHKPGMPMECHLVCSHGGHTWLFEWVHNKMTQNLDILVGLEQLLQQVLDLQTSGTNAPHASTSLDGTPQGGDHHAAADSAADVISMEDALAHPAVQGLLQSLLNSATAEDLQDLQHMARAAGCVQTVALLAHLTQLLNIEATQLQVSPLEPDIDEKAVSQAITGQAARLAAAQLIFISTLVFNLGFLSVHWFTRAHDRGDMSWLGLPPSSPLPLFAVAETQHPNPQFALMFILASLIFMALVPNYHWYLNIYRFLKLVFLPVHALLVALQVVDLELTITSMRWLVGRAITLAVFELALIESDREYLFFNLVWLPFVLLSMAVMGHYEPKPVLILVLPILFGLVGYGLRLARFDIKLSRELSAQPGLCGSCVVLALALGSQQQLSDLGVSEFILSQVRPGF